MTNIYSAIQNLPPELITPEIYEAAIKEGNIKLINTLPQGYLTEDNINYILDKNENYNWESFSLSAIPEKARTSKVCEAAVEKSIANYPIVPESKRTTSMLMKIVVNAERYINYLAYVPESTWDMEAVNKGISSIYHSGNSNYSSRRYYSSSSSDKDEQMKLIQIFLYYVPERIKTKEFYLGFFKTSMQVSDISFLVPTKYKTTDYFTELAKKDILKIPIYRLNLNILKAGLLSKDNNINSLFGGYNNTDKSFLTRLYELIDDDIADIIIRRDPTKLSKLPIEFQTKQRLLLALNGASKSDARYVYGHLDSTKFDEDICKSIVRLQEWDCPEFASEIWTRDFIDYCLENATNYKWYKIMPMKHQTQEIADVALKECISLIEYTRPKFITYESAIEAFRENYSNYFNKNSRYRQYIPKHYFEDFEIETGLPEEFFGGERSYMDFRDKKENYTYCRIGECYIGFYEDKDYRNTYNRLIMTRRNQMSIMPSIVFNRTIGTFHKTWLEKMISDNDSLFVKPIPAKGLKCKQVNLYMNVSLEETINNTHIYAHSLMGEEVLFAAKIEEREYIYSTLEQLKNKLVNDDSVSAA